MSPLGQIERALLAIKKGYEVDELTMLDDSMVGHVEDVIGEHDLLLEVVQREMARPRATPEEIEEARRIAQCDDVQVDFDARVSRGEDGGSTWVQAWVRL